MKFIKEVVYTLKTTDYIDIAFKQLPVNAFIHKGRCGIGGTTIETDDKSRNTVFIVPTKGIIEDKTTVLESDTPEEQERKKSIFALTKDTSDQDILDWLKVDKVGKKCMVLPDNFKKLIRVATKNNLLEKLYSGFFLLIDEGHSIVTEDFREAMLIPLDYFWEFKRKSIISATPYIFSDPRFRELELHTIKFKNPDELETYVDEIRVIEAVSVYATLKKIIELTEGNLHIFLNSVTDIAQTIQYCNIENCNVYCNDKQDNQSKLAFKQGCFTPMPINGEYAKVNFYTSKYFEGWDLKDEKATLVLLTNVYQDHTRVGISNKGVQAMGRIRRPDHKLIHITNHRNIKTMKSREEISREYAIRAAVQIKNYNGMLETYKENGLEPTKEELEIVEQYAELDDKTKSATLRYEKLDQLVNRQIGDEQYNHISYIKKVWEDAGFLVTHQKSNLIKEQVAEQKTKRLSKVKLFEQIADKIQELYKQKEEFVFNSADEQLAKIKNDYPTIYDGYHILGVDKLKEIGFREKQVIHALIEQQNIDAEPKLLKLLDVEFKVHQRYPKAHIKDRLTTLNQSLGIDRKATAEQLGEDGRFDITPCKMKDKNGKTINGFLILRKQFELKMVAQPYC